MRDRAAGVVQLRDGGCEHAEQSEVRDCPSTFHYLR
jgi:hypothetical protein